MWKVIHSCLSSAIFVFNYYQHHTQFIVRKLYGTDDTILVCKGVDQGDPLTMVVYGMGVILLIEDIQ